MTTTDKLAPVTLTYTNWKGETADRTIVPRHVWFGSTEWHPEPQWLLSAWDVEKGAERDFALKDFGRAQSAPAPVAWMIDLDGTGSLHVTSKGRPGAVPVYLSPAPAPLIETCESGHRYAKLADHPMRDGLPRCPNCMAQGLDTYRNAPAPDALRDAAMDLLSWFDPGPSSYGPWILPAGPQGADDAVSSLRAALTHSPAQEGGE